MVVSCDTGGIGVGAKVCLESGFRAERPNAVGIGARGKVGREIRRLDGSRCEAAQDRDGTQKA